VLSGITKSVVICHSSHGKLMVNDPSPVLILETLLSREGDSGVPTCSYRQERTETTEGAPQSTVEPGERRLPSFPRRAPDHYNVLVNHNWLQHQKRQLQAEPLPKRFSEDSFSSGSAVIKFPYVQERKTWCGKKQHCQSFLPRTLSGVCMNQSGFPPCPLGWALGPLNS
jgi:hypothetical protein